MKPILRDLPDQIESERLLIRCPRPGDGAQINAAIQESFDELHEWMPFAKTRPPVEDTEEFVRGACAAYIARERLPMIFFLKTSGDFVGSSGFHEIDWDIPKFEIGYWVRSSFAGRGFVSEVVNRLTVFAFETLGARRVQIRMDDRNVRSWRVAERCGYALEGVLRNDALDNDGQPRNTRFYSRVA